MATANQSETRQLTSTGAPRVRVENHAGLIEVVAWERDAIEVQVEKSAPDPEGLDRLQVEISGGPDEVLVTSGATEPQLDSWVDFKLRCPRGTSLDLHNASGEVLVSGFYGASRVATASGPIHTARMHGTATLTSTSGSIKGAVLEGTVYARSASGDVVLQGHLGSGHRLETASGSIDIDSVNGSVDARSASGSIRVVGKLTGRSSIRTGSGDIRVRLLEGSSVRLHHGGQAQAQPAEARSTGLLVLETTSGKIEVEQLD
jgi:hypothetical protein